jgi:hypothetical protein
MAVDTMRLLAGDRLTAHAYNLGEPTYAWKTSDETVTSSIVDQLDDELFLPVEPFAVYLVLACYAVSGPDTADVRLGYAVPDGAQGRRHNIGPTAGAAGSTATMRISVHGWPTAVTYGISTTPVSIIEEGVLYTEAAGGLLHMRWAQNVTNAGGVSVLASSFIRLQQVIAQ